MEYIHVADKAELPVNKMIMVVVGGKEILLTNVDGSYYAIANKCTHAGGSLAKGSLDWKHCHMPKTWFSIRLEDGEKCKGSQDWIHQD